MVGWMLWISGCGRAWVAAGLKKAGIENGLVPDVLAGRCLMANTAAVVAVAVAAIVSRSVSMAGLEIESILLGAV